MSTSQIHTSEEKLREVVSNLPIFAGDLRINLREIVLAFQRLGSTWRDEEYDQFRRCLPPLEKIIDEMIAELARHQGSLQNDLENLARLRQIKV